MSVLLLLVEALLYKPKFLHVLDGIRDLLSEFLGDGRMPTVVILLLYVDLVEETLVDNPGFLRRLQT